MKRCPTCNQTFDEEWLSFCTIDGTALVESGPLRSEPPPTIRASGIPTNPTGQPTFNFPGIFTVTFGWCYIGVLTGPIAIVLGIISLVQIKKSPERNTGKPMAIAGIVMGAVYFVIIAVFILFAVLMQGVK